MGVQAGFMQGDVFMIGASCGVVLEFKTRTLAEAQQLRDILAIALDAAIKKNGGMSVMDNPFYELDGMTLHEIFNQIVETAVRGE